MSEVHAPYRVAPLPEPLALTPLAAWERDALYKLRLLREAGKPAILWMTADGIILVYRGEVAGRIAP